MHPWLHYEKAMLQSLLNMKLRDFYHSLEQLCEDLDIDYQELLDVLQTHHLVYVKEINQLRDQEVVS
jgi:hypothetical protein